jgi:hypothetical protein
LTSRADEYITIHTGLRILQQVNPQLRDEQLRQRDSPPTGLALGIALDYVALGYALTVHKAQGSTVDRGIVLVDEQMTTQQLYVAMSRGREMNAALVVEQRCDPGLDVFWSSRRLTPVELLANVMRRDGAERSAHDVARENLAHMEDIGLLGHLLAEARRDLDERAGPDRNAQIVALRPRADVQRTNQELTGAQWDLRCAKERLKSAETALVAANTRPSGALLPGLLVPLSINTSRTYYHVSVALR